MNRQELLERMSAINSSAQSKLHMRSETLQVRHTARRIPMLKKELKKKSKLLIIADLAIPFDPSTGEETAQFNTDNKYRPPYSATTVALALKAMADENAATKEAFIRRAGVTEWDTSGETLTKEDWEIFSRYRVPRIFTVPVVHINIPVMTDSDYGRDYSISVEYDDLTGEVIGAKNQDGTLGEVPGVLKINKLFRDKLWTEVQALDREIKETGQHYTDKQIKEKKSEIYKKNPVSDVQPSNWVTIVELPLTNQYNLTGDIDYSDVSPDTVRGCLVITRLPKKMKDAIGKFIDKSWEKYDKNFDFFEIDMACPVSGDANSAQGKMLIGKDTEYEKPTDSLVEQLPEGSNFISAVTEYLDDCEDIEEEVRRSMYISPYTPTVEEQLFSSLKTVLDIDHDKFITQEILEANREVISIAFAGSGAELLDALDAGVSDAPSSELNEQAAKAEAKKYSLESAEFNDDSEDDYEIDMDSVVLA